MPQPAASATQPPIVANPPDVAIAPGSAQIVLLKAVLAPFSATVTDPAIAMASFDENAGTVTIVGEEVGSTTVTVTDARGLTGTIPVRVAFPAGNVSATAIVRVTGDPATQIFVRDQAVAAAVAAASSRPGASVLTAPESVSVPSPLAPDDVIDVDVPLVIAGTGYLNVQGTTRVRVENVALPRVAPRSLLVSDFPETLHENGTLFTADLTPRGAERFLYYHYNPPSSPQRRIVLRVRNASARPALVQYISGIAPPETNEMDAGHLSTQRFLVRRAQNEGIVLALPPLSTTTLSQQPLPSGQTVSGLVQLNEFEGGPLHLWLIAQDANESPDAAIPTSPLLVGDKPHARGVYRIPEFYFERSYDAAGPNLEVPIGRIALPNVMRGETLGGDYGVLQALTVRIVNDDRRRPRQVALYANPRGGPATGTFIIDRVLVQAHAMAPFGHYKLRQYTIPPGSFVRSDIVTMPEGGSSYPLDLIMAPDDGSPPPGAPGSPVY